MLLPYIDYLQLLPNTDQLQLLPNTDLLQQVEDYVRGCTTSTKY